MESTTPAATITELGWLFAIYGLPEQVVTDNGPQFSASEFSNFLKSNGMKCIQCVHTLPPLLQWSSGTVHTNISENHQSRRNTRSYIPLKTYELSACILVYTALNNRCGTMCFIPQQRLENTFPLTEARCERSCHVTTSCTEISK